MHVCELIEVAGTIALHGPLLVAGPRVPSTTCLEQYWSASKCRCENWNRTLKTCATLERHEWLTEWDNGISARATLDEIFASELLARVWTAVLTACDQPTTRSAAPVARNVFDSHLEVRHRALALLVDGSRFSPHELVAVNRLRKRVERWCDLLLGGLWHFQSVREFAIDARRAEDFAQDLGDRRRESGGRQAWRLTLASLRNSFRKELATPTANPEANARIAASVLGCFPEDTFDSTGQFRSLWMMRLSANASDAQGMIEDLLGNSTTSSATLHVPRRRK